MGLCGLTPLATCRSLHFTISHSTRKQRRTRALIALNRHWTGIGCCDLACLGELPLYNIIKCGGRCLLTAFRACTGAERILSFNICSAVAVAGAHHDRHGLFWWLWQLLSAGRGQTIVLIQCGQMSAWAIKHRVGEQVAISSSQCEKATGGLWPECHLRLKLAPVETRWLERLFWLDGVKIPRDH